MAKCPNCGAELKKQGDNVYVCEQCNTSVTMNAPEPSSQQQSASDASDEARIKELEARLAAIEAEKTKKSRSTSRSFIAKDGKVATFFKKYWVYVLAGTLLFIAFLTLMITLVGLRGIYVNVNDSHDFYDFDATSYRASSIDLLTGEDALEEGKWQIKGNKLVLTIDDELFGKISDDFDFEKLDGYKRIKIDGEEYKRISLVGLKTTQQKVKVTFHPQNGEKDIVYTLKIGAVFKNEIPEVSYGTYPFEGWFDQPTHDGERCDIEEERIWEDMDFYAVWHTEHYASTYQHDENYHWQICEYAYCNEQVPNTYGSHDSFEWQTVKEATCTEYGQQNYACTTCGYATDTRQLDLVSHEMSDWKLDGDFPCTTIRHRDCANCDYSEIDYDYDDRTPHDFDPVTKKCTICQSNNFSTGDTLYFGEYPQTRETDNGITASLAQMSGTRPVKGNSGKWTDYGYYISGKVDEYMWYIDLDYNGARYRGVYFTSYRPYLMEYSGEENNSVQNGNGYVTNTLYWFKWEPIKWRVLERTDGELFLMSNVILDSQQYYHDATIDGKTVYPNNYKESDIRKWLNRTFYDQAFDSVEQSIIKTTLVDNGAETTASSSNSYACENTNDKVFLLSYKEATNTSYGFSSDSTRQLQPTDYAKSQGAEMTTLDSYKGNGYWWVRSPYSNSAGSALYIIYSGYTEYSANVNTTNHGVVPALKISL